MPILTLSHQMPWVRHPDRDLRLQSAINLASLVLATEGFYPAHRNELLSVAIWKATEVDGKWKTRFRSKGVMHGPVGMEKINHEHVVTRRWLRASMISSPNRVAELLSKAVGCLVTVTEHQQLGPGWGWERYIIGGVTVIDSKTGHELDLEKAQGELLRVMSRGSTSVSL